jgi:hypothetical protein
MQDAGQCITLTGVSALIHDCLHPAIAHVYCGRPTPDAGGTQTVQTYRAKMPAVDLEARYCAAVPMRRKRVELAGTSVRAVAVREFPTLDLPRGYRHIGILFVTVTTRGPTAIIGPGK